MNFSNLLDIVAKDSALKNADWDEVLADARPFVESPQELAMLNQESLLELLG